jgi:hypothetical protein
MGEKDAVLPLIGWNKKRSTARRAGFF